MSFVSLRIFSLYLLNLSLLIDFRRVKCLMSVYFIMSECISSILNLSLWGQQLLPIPQASKIKVVSYMLRSKDHVLHQIKKIIYEACVHKRKKDVL